MQKRARDLHPQLPTRILADTQVNIPLFFWVGFIPSQVGRGDLALLLVRFPAGSLVLGKRRTSSSTSRGRRSQPSLPRGGIPRAPVTCRTQNLRCDFMILRHNGCVCLINCRQRATLFVSFFLTSVFLLMGFFPILFYFLPGGLNLNPNCKLLRNYDDLENDNPTGFCCSSSSSNLDCPLQGGHWR